MTLLIDPWPHMVIDGKSTSDIGSPVVLSVVRTVWEIFNV